MQAPENAQVFEGEIASYWFDQDGILVSSSKSVKRTVENITKNLELIRRITGGKKACLLVYLCPSPVPDKPTRELVNRELPNVYRAMAMVSKSGLGKIIMNFLFKMKAPPIPMKTFSGDAAAREWLKQYLG